jgi:GT2 family glycosyltransferase
MKVDLLCVNYNTKDLLIRFLSTLEYDPDLYDITVCDNGSVDGSREWLQEHADQYPAITNVVLNDNIGYSAAINHAASITNNQILCAVNADTWFSNKHIHDMVKCFEDHPNIAIAGPKQLDENRRIRHAGIFWPGIKAFKPKHRGWSVYDAEDKLYKDLVPCWTISGSIYYVRRSVWNEMYNHPEYRKLYPDAIGAFLPTKHYFEETFCSQWAQKLGYEVWYNGEAETAGHTWGGSQDPNESSRLYFRESQQIYIDACNKLGIEHEC